MYKFQGKTLKFLYEVGEFNEIVHAIEVSRYFDLQDKLPLLDRHVNSRQI